MILGVGNDIIAVSRIESILKRHGERFLSRVFTEKERAYCLQKPSPSRHLAGRFAAKEAVSKAFGTGFSSGLQWIDIEILPGEKGRPTLVFSPFVYSFFGDPLFFHLSISHCQDYATAVAIWEAAHS